MCTYSLLQIGFDRVEVKGGLGGESRQLDVVYEVELVYLDDNLRITRTKVDVTTEGPQLSTAQQSWTQQGSKQQGPVLSTHRYISADRAGQWSLGLM
jgi:hypothetical protein